MQAKSSPTIQKTFTEQARRAQIVAAAIAVIAEVGYSNASFARIARQAGIKSTGIISYHFASKQELDAEIVTHILGSISKWMTRRMEAVSTPTQALQRYIEGIVEYMRLEGPNMQALSSLLLHGGMEWGGEQDDAAKQPLEDILRWGQEAGEFRKFDPFVMGIAIQRSLDGIPFLLNDHPDLDLEHYARELVTTFTIATRHHA